MPIKIERPLIAVDTEVSGLDIYHGAALFFVTECDENNQQSFWEFDVNPLTRKSFIHDADKREIQASFKGKRIVGQNIKYDSQILVESGIEIWDWKQAYDTLYSAHLLKSNAPHDLTSLALTYLGINILPFEERLKKAVNECRAIAKKQFPEWRLAKKGLPEMPGVKGSPPKKKNSNLDEKPWKNDCWICRAVAQELNLPNDHFYWRALQEYGNTDSAVTLPLFKVMEEELKDKGLWLIYLERLKLLPVMFDMERRGISLNYDRLKELRGEYQRDSEIAARICTTIARTFKYDLELPKSGNNDSLKKFIFEVLKLPVMGTTEKGAPSLDGETVKKYQAILPANSKALLFLNNLSKKRKRDKGIEALTNYERFMIHEQGPWYRVHSSYNTTGTGTLRKSSSNPNATNVSTQEIAEFDEGEGKSPRYVFGPAPGREWWSIDFSNLELGLVAYRSGEKEIIELLEQPDKPPYYGSFHSMMFETVYPVEFNACASFDWDLKGRELQKYKKVKNGDFSVTYCSVEESGTADKAYGVPGSYRKIKHRLSRIHGKGGFNDQCIAFAEVHGYVEAFIDHAVDSNRGYPVFIPRGKYGRIKITCPLNYVIQTTACYVMCKAEVKVYNYLKSISKPGKEYHLAIDVHDEAVMDFPFVPDQGNLPIVKRVAELMESVGKDIRIPLRVNISYHPENWGVSV